MTIKTASKKESTDKVKPFEKKEESKVTQMGLVAQTPEMFFNELSDLQFKITKAQLQAEETKEQYKESAADLKKLQAQREQLLNRINEDGRQIGLTQTPDLAGRVMDQANIKTPDELKAHAPEIETAEEKKEVKPEKKEKSERVPF